jgi:hypothetical protein
LYVELHLASLAFRNGESLLIFIWQLAAFHLLNSTSAFSSDGKRRPSSRINRFSSSVRGSVRRVSVSSFGKRCQTPDLRNSGPLRPPRGQPAVWLFLTSLSLSIRRGANDDASAEISRAQSPARHSEGSRLMRGGAEAKRGN